MRLVSSVVFLAVVIGGCGSSDSGGPAASAGSTPAAEATPAPAKDTATVDIKDFKYAPKTVTVATGGTVTWTDSDTANHNVAFDDEGQKGFNNIRSGEEKSVTFSKPGTFAYVCTYHPGMAGTVEVR